MHLVHSRNVVEPDESRVLPRNRRAGLADQERRPHLRRHRMPRRRVAIEPLFIRFLAGDDVDEADLEPRVAVREVERAGDLHQADHVLRDDVVHDLVIGADHDSVARPGNPAPFPCLGRGPDAGLSRSDQRHIVRPRRRPDGEPECRQGPNSEVDDVPLHSIDLQSVQGNSMLIGSKRRRDSR